ncbi:putative transcription factor NAM family [Helianthus annuus]|nr:putative transcription factor NAM family [Helianthus annuus]KAJ0587689.1 putative transcription factor NAM family [Helianthus annuus]KAJ0596166.1 putative transcription factor NAM family [Helianthus annuus]KAJ0756817.1 putative transcription factor NAM family [Helianthus annuus]KAJ0760560.1 putative transcription factor NAM family [Helianthus annuus]
MCPSCVPLAAENEYWTDETICMSLFNFKSGEPLPLNVTSDVNPYQHKPSDLPAGLWYLCSGVKTDAECGFWQETEAACEIFSNAVILGLRTTLQFHEGRAPHGRKTEWVMQEYRITNKYDNDPMDLRALCRVFLADENRPPSGHCTADINVKISVNFGPKAVSASDPESPGHFLENSSERDCILTGDYFELNDLVDRGSRSSSSSDSSGLTMTSEEYVDPIALLQELQDDLIDQEMNDSSGKLNPSAPVKSKEVVLHTATSVAYPRNNKECKPSSEKTSKAEKRTASTSNGVKMTSYSSICENTSKEGNNEHVRRTKRRKIMKYLCFLAF